MNLWREGITAKRALVADADLLCAGFVARVCIRRLGGAVASIARPAGFTSGESEETFFILQNSRAKRLRRRQGVERKCYGGVTRIVEDELKGTTVRRQSSVSTRLTPLKGPYEGVYPTPLYIYIFLLPDAVNIPEDGCTEQ